VASAAKITPSSPPFGWEFTIFWASRTSASFGN
jgi:hypothetical protein